MLICLACYQDRMATLCENAESFRLFRVEEGKPVADGELRINGNDPAALASSLSEAGVSELLCGGITGCSRRSLGLDGVKVTSWIRGTQDEVLNAWQEGSLDSLTMPGCGGPRCGRGMGLGAGQGRGLGQAQGTGQGRAGRGLRQGLGMRRGFDPNRT